MVSKLPAVDFEGLICYKESMFGGNRVAGRRRQLRRQRTCPNRGAEGGRKMKAHADVFAVLSEHFREPNDYVEGLLEIARQFDDLSVEDLAEAIRCAHPLPNWELGTVEGIARSLDSYFAVEQQENQYSSDTVQTVLHACFKAIMRMFKESSQKEAEKYLHSVCLIFHRLDPDFFDDRGSIQSFVRRCGRELDERAVRFTLPQAAEYDADCANLLATGMIERLGPNKVLQAYWERKEGIPADGDKTATRLRVMSETCLRVLLTLHSDSQSVVDGRRAVCTAFATMFGIEAALAIVQEVRPDLVGELGLSTAE